jgi:hypothetical protein
MAAGGVRRTDQDIALNLHFRFEINPLSATAPLGKFQNRATISCVRERRDAIPGANPLKEVSRIQKSVFCSI